MCQFYYYRIPNKKKIGKQKLTVVWYTPPQLKDQVLSLVRNHKKKSKNGHTWDALGAISFSLHLGHQVSQLVEIVVVEGITRRCTNCNLMISHRILNCELPRIKSSLISTSLGPNQRDRLLFSKYIKFPKKVQRYRLSKGKIGKMINTWLSTTYHTFIHSAATTSLISIIFGSCTFQNHILTRPSQELIHHTTHQ